MTEKTHSQVAGMAVKKKAGASSACENPSRCAPTAQKQRTARTTTCLALQPVAYPSWPSLGRSRAQQQTYDVHTASPPQPPWACPLGPGLLCISSTGLVVHQWGLFTVLPANGSARKKGHWHVKMGETGTKEKRTRGAVLRSCSSRGLL